MHLQRKQQIKISTKHHIRNPSIGNIKLKNTQPWVSFQRAEKRDFSIWELPTASIRGRHGVEVEEMELLDSNLANFEVQVSPFYSISKKFLHSLLFFFYLRDWKVGVGENGKWQQMAEGEILQR